LEGVYNGDLLVRIKEDIALFIQTMEVSHPVASHALLFLTMHSGLGIFCFSSEQFPARAISQVYGVTAGSIRDSLQRRESTDAGDIGHR
jgi:hypothetical protein